MSEGKQAPSLEMRVAAIEDKLSGVTVTQEEIQAYQKVAALMAGRGSSGVAFLPHYFCIISPIIGGIHQIPITIPQPIVQDCIQASAGSATSSTGFETFGR